MIILASKPQIWPCFAVGSSISGDRAALPWLRSLSVAKLVGSERQVHGMDDILSVGQSQGEKPNTGIRRGWVELCHCITCLCCPGGGERWREHFLIIDLCRFPC